MDLDSQNFDPKRYVLTMLKTHSIKDLIKKNNDVEQDIKVHDHQIQSLVFENYSKFISSIDTVRQMKNNICKVDEKLKVLDTSMEKISQLALKIDSKFSVKRKEIQKLDTINKDLQKLKNLCDFPNLLKQDLVYFKGLPESKLSAQASALFDKSIQSYESCYQTLISLRDQPLISPIFKQSANKVDEVRTILRNLQAQFKGKNQSKILRQITKKLLVVSEDQVSVLRSYFLPWKQRLSEGPFKGERANMDQQLPELLSAQIPELNQNLWNQFEAEILFLSAIRKKLKLNQEVQLLMNNFFRDIFNFVFNNYSEAVPLYCTSLRAFVQVNHLIVTRIRTNLKSLPEKMTSQIQTKLFEKVASLGKMMLRFLFGRLKVGYIRQLLDCKRQCQQIPKSQQAYKLANQKLLNILKDYIASNYKLLLNDLQILQTSRQSVFDSDSKLHEAIHTEIQQLLKAISYLSFQQVQYFSEEGYLMINSGYSVKMNRKQKDYIESAVKEYLLNNSQSGCWFIVIHNFLNILSNNYGKKIIENAQKRLEMESSNHDYAPLFTTIKAAISKNLVALANYYVDKISHQNSFKNIYQLIENFISIINVIYPQTRRTMIKKPSFLNEATFSHQTLTAKKLHVFDKKNPTQRGPIVGIFIRKILKNTLIRVRAGVNYKQGDIYSIVQISYQLSSVEEQGQISAFYYLLESEVSGSWSATKQDLENFYSEQRKIINQQN